MIKELQTAIMGSDRSIRTILKHRPQGVTLTGQTATKTIMCAQAASSYMKDVLDNTFALLKSYGSISNRVYPSVPHSLYRGNYTELFAFLLLRYLMRVDVETVKSRQKQKSFAVDTDKKLMYDIVPTENIAAREQRDAQQGLAFDHGDLNGKDVGDALIFDANKFAQDHPNVTENKNAVKMRNEEGRSVYYGERTREANYDKNKYPAFLKPTRGTKILLVSDVNYFCSRLGPHVMRGLGILVNAGIIPGGFIKDLKICNMFSGGLFNIGIGKSGLAISPCRTYSTYASLPDTKWSQYAVMFDIDVPGLSYLSGVELNQLPASLFFSNTNFKVAYSDITKDTTDFIKSLPTNTNVGTFEDEFSATLSKHLLQQSVFDFSKAKKQGGLDHYNELSNYALYGNDSDIINGEYLIWGNFLPYPGERNVTFDKFNNQREISYNHYVKGLTPKIIPIGHDIETIKDKAQTLLTGKRRLVFHSNLDPSGGVITRFKEMNDIKTPTHSVQQQMAIEH